MWSFTSRTEQSHLSEKNQGYYSTLYVRRRILREPQLPFLASIAVGNAQSRVFVEILVSVAQHCVGHVFVQHQSLQFPCHACAIFRHHSQSYARVRYGRTTWFSFPRIACYGDTMKFEWHLIAGELEKSGEEVEVCGETVGSGYLSAINVCYVLSARTLPPQLECEQEEPSGVHACKF